MVKTFAVNYGWMKSLPDLQESVSKAAMSLGEKFWEINPDSDPNGAMNDNSGNSETNVSKILIK